MPSFVLIYAGSSASKISGSRRSDWDDSCHVSCATFLINVAWKGQGLGDS